MADKKHTDNYIKQMGEPTDSNPVKAVVIWNIEYNNSVCTGFDEWWEVSDGKKTFKCDEECDAKWLMELLNNYT